MFEKAIGIDLGTTNSCVAVVEDGVPQVIANRGGYRVTPSVVAISEKGRRLVGHIAKRQAVTNAENTAYAVKRLIGRTWNSPPVQAVRELGPFKLVEGPHQDVRVQLRDQVFSIPEISAFVLQEMKVVAEQQLGAAVQQGGHHRARLLQRQPAPGHQGRRPHRRAGGHAHHQRADRGGAGLRLRQEGRGARSRCSTWAAAPSTSRSWRSRNGVFEVLSTAGRHLPGRRGLRPPDHRLAGDRVRQGAQGEPAQGSDGHAAAEGRRRAGQVRAVQRARGGDQPPLHHLGRARTSRCTCSGC